MASSTPTLRESVRRGGRSALDSRRYSKDAARTARHPSAPSSSLSSALLDRPLPPPPPLPALPLGVSGHEHRGTSGQDEDEINGVVGAVRHFQPFQRTKSSLSQPLPEINIAVIGAEGVGKSTFVQNALELPCLPSQSSAERKFPVQGNTYLVRLLELPIQNIDINDDDTISWPDIIEDKIMPKVDGALALYDVKDKASVIELPEMLNAITKASVPAVLVSCKCDTPPSEREIDPAVVEQDAKRAIGNISTLQIPDVSPESNTCRRGILILLNDILRSNAENHARSLSARRRAKSSATRSSSPRHIAYLGHSRASSEFTGGLLKEQRHGRHDSTSIGHSSGDRLQVPRDKDQMQSSFLFEESPSEPSLASSSSSSNVDLQVMSGANPTSASLAENGATFDELVDRLLSQPTSKGDLKFADIFLALYRKFATPGKLLESIVDRFDTLERNGIPQILKTQTQLRYIGLIEQWVSWYPGDFAFPQTKRRLKTFITKLSKLNIFAQSAKEISSGLDIVREDDDTNWACCDRDRDTSQDQSRSSISSTASTLLDDSTFSFDEPLSGSTLAEEIMIEHLPTFANQMMANVEHSQMQAQLLQSLPRNPMSKSHWRALMDQPDELIARELTRMDWIMFSAIRPRDLVRHVSVSKEQRSAYRNLIHVDRMVEHFNHLARWIANYVLLRDKPKHRVLMLEKFMRIARKLREMNNYNALGAVIAGVKSTSVHRLAATRELLPPSVGKDWLKLEILMAPSRSHFAYRLAWENSSSERIPYLPLHLRDLATAEEGNKTLLGDEEHRINWKKFEILGDVVVNVRRAQTLPYTNLGGSKGHELIRELVFDVRLVKDEDELYERSLQCEPSANSTSSQGTSSKLREFFKR